MHSSDWNDVDYRKSKAEWLKEKRKCIPTDQMTRDIDQAFDLQPSEEKPKPEFCKCAEPKESITRPGNCGRCYKPLKPSPSMPAVPNRLGYSDKHLGEIKMLADTINALRDCVQDLQQRVGKR